MKKKLAKLLLCVVLEAGAAFGVPITPDQIEKIMSLSDTQIVHVIKRARARRLPRRKLRRRE